MSNKKRISKRSWLIELPGDLADDLNTLAEHAIQQAREGADDWVTPARWEAEHVSGEVGDWEVTFKVTRYS